MKEVIEQLINESGDLGVAQVQIQLRGNIYSGAIRRCKNKKVADAGIYEMAATMQKADRSVAMVRVFVKAEEIDSVMVPMEEQVVKPAGGLVIPGRSQ